jgi:1-acyl-sn-glycerol-3-phosphate acyltransferase
MHEFESIRPYRDEEVAAVVKRLIHDPKLIDAASRLFMPRLNERVPGLARLLTRLLLGWQARPIDSIDDFQEFLSIYFGRLIRKTIAELTVSGVDKLDPKQAYLFISNHRDITMDTGLINITLHQAGRMTPEAAVGDNLLTEPIAADLMRLNKSFVIERSVTGKRAIYRVLTRTSHYIQDVLKGGHSVWIAQREGRAKDGFDRTDPALLKMLALAWRKEAATFGELLEKVSLVPVAISYELDPCDGDKAHELALLDRDGAYEKASDEDLMSIIQGLTGFKGRVHVHYDEPLHGDFATSDDLAAAIDRRIVTNLKVFPTQAEAARKLGYEPVPAVDPWLPEVRASFDERIARCPAWELPFLLASYGNLIRNRAELASSVSEAS